MLTLGRKFTPNEPRDESGTGLPLEVQEESPVQNFYDINFVGKGGMSGYGVKDPNFSLRFFLIIFSGVAAFGVILFWRSQLFISAEYQEMPTTTKQVQTKKHNQILRQKEAEKMLLEEQQSQ